MQERSIIPRTIFTISTKLGSARVKVAQRPHGKTIQPEYEDCINLAKTHQMALPQVQEIILQTAQALGLEN